MKEFHFPNAVVRIHEGKLTAEERKAVIEEAAKDFMRAVLRQGIKIGGEVKHEQATVDRP